MVARAWGQDMAWVYLLVAAAFEVQWAITLKYTEGFSRLWPSVAGVLGLKLVTKTA